MTELALTTPLPAAYAQMIDSITERLPAISESSQAFYKSDSQVKMVTLDVNDLTDIGAAKHILARIERKRAALRESEIGLRRKRIDLAEAEERLATAEGYDAQRLEVDIVELASQIEDTTNYQAGAVREIRHLVEQYEAICQRLGVDIITEEMYEADQPRYHVIRAFSQALAAARSRQGLIDEGNFIYFQDLGINGAAAQRELIAYLETEQQVLNEGRVPTFEMQHSWLMAVGDKFAGEVSRYAEHRGLRPHTPEALATRSLESA